MALAMKGGKPRNLLVDVFAINEMGFILINHAGFMLMIPSLSGIVLPMFPPD